MAMTDGPALVFERLSSAGLPLVHLWLALGRPAYCLSIADGLRDRPSTKSLLVSGQIGTLVVEQRGHYLYDAHALSLENIDRFYSAEWDSHKLINALKVLYGTDEIARAFKKELNAKLSDFYSVHWTIHSVSRILDGRPFIYIPSRTDGVHILTGANGYETYLHRLIKAGCAVLEAPGRLVPWWLRIADAALGIAERLSAVLETAGASAWLTASCVGKPGTKVSSAKIAVNVVAPQRQFANETQWVGFLVEGKTIRSEDVLVVSGLPLKPTQKEILRHGGLHWLDDLKNRLSTRTSRRALPHALRALPHAIFGNHLLARTAARLAYQNAKWSGVLERASFKHFISYCDMMDPQTIPRNLLMRAAGVQTWFYLDSANVMCYYASEKSPAERMVHKAFAFMLYDHLISWSAELTRFYRDFHKGDFRHVHEIGCLWSEHLVDAARGSSEGALRKRLSSRAAPGAKIIAVFDSTYNDEALLGYADGTAFIEGIRRLADALPDAHIVLKEKKSHSTFPDPATREAYETLSRHPRVLLVEPRESPSELMALSDLVVSFPFTSTTFEALAAGRKALWFDPTAKLRATFFDKISGLVCHDEQALERRCRELLYETDDAAWSRFIAERVRGVIEPYCDGRALTRWRELLA